jgi:hypothetical protein
MLQIACSLVAALPACWLAYELRLLRTGRTDADTVDRWYASLMRARASLDAKRRGTPPRIDY